MPTTGGKRQRSTDALVRQLFQNIFECSPVGVVVCDSNLLIVAVNAAWAAMDGVSVEEHRGKTVSQVLGVGAFLVETEMKKVLSSGFGLFGLEIMAKVPARSGLVRWIAQLIPLRDKTGRTTHVGSLTVETTPRVGFESYLVAHSYPLLSTLETEIARDRDEDVSEHLTPREIEVTRLLARGKGNKEISGVLKISVGTVETHRRRIMKALNFHSVAELAVYAERHGLIRG